MKLKSVFAVLKAVILVVVVVAAVIAFFSYDVIESVEIADDVPHVKTITHTMKNGRTMDVIVTDRMTVGRDGVYNIKLLIKQNHLKSTYEYNVRNMRAVLSLPKDAVIVSASCNDANEQFHPEIEEVGNRLHLTFACTSDYLDVDLKIEGLNSFEPTLDLYYDIYGNGLRVLSRFLGQQQRLELNLLDEEEEEKS